MRLIFLLAALTAGCALVDQTTFGVPATPPAPDQLTDALQSRGAIPLVTIRYDGAAVAYAESLATAIDAAEARKPDVTFDVVTAVPAVGDPAAQVRAIEQGQGDAQQVMDWMADDGVTPDRIHLSARTDPTIRAREVRIYVR